MEQNPPPLRRSRSFMNSQRDLFLYNKVISLSFLSISAAFIQMIISLVSSKGSFSQNALYALIFTVAIPTCGVFGARFKNRGMIQVFWQCNFILVVSNLYAMCNNISVLLAYNSLNDQEKNKVNTSNTSGLPFMVYGSLITFISIPAAILQCYSVTYGRLLHSSISFFIYTPPLPMFTSTVVVSPPTASSSTPSNDRHSSRIIPLLNSSSITEQDLNNLALLQAISNHHRNSINGGNIEMTELEERAEMNQAINTLLDIEMARRLSMSLEGEEGEREGHSANTISVIVRSSSSSAVVPAIVREDDKERKKITKDILF